jgi:hypothetical protein
MDAKKRLLPLLEEWLKTNGWRSMRRKSVMPNSEWRRPKQVWRKQAPCVRLRHDYMSPRMGEFRCTLGHLGVTFEKLGMVPKFRSQLAWLTQTHGLYSHLRIEDGMILGLKLAKRLVDPDYIKQ